MNTGEDYVPVRTRVLLGVVVVSDTVDDDSTDSPEQCQAVQHLTKSLASLVAQVEPLPEFGASRSINSANVLDVRVDARSQGSTFGQ